jgi:hypothetical protein
MASTASKLEGVRLEPEFAEMNFDHKQGGIQTAV